MSLLNCKECGSQISDTSKTCPHCGAPSTMAVGLSNQNKAGKILVGVFSIFAGLVLIIWNLSKEYPSYMDRELADKYFEISSQLHIAGLFLILIGIIILWYVSRAKTK
ncbi:MAG: hypothetical protein A2V66_16915 [Ignavibacteria bacterium RBG_13_36_8]|nr:MAG: hypothetical protein A2V66_16915 [Ignavibacteria bacterium RBG_13_36_8]